MKAVVFYKSVSGFTEKYATMIGTELGCPVFRIENTKVDLSDYDTIIFGGGLYASGIVGLKRFKKYLPKNFNSRVFVFAVGLSLDKQGITEEIWENNHLNELGKERTRLFFLRGGFDFKKLNFGHKIVMWLMYMILKGKKDRNSEEEGMLQAYTTSVDFTSKENIRALILSVKKEM